MSEYIDFVIGPNGWWLALAKGTGITLTLALCTLPLGLSGGLLLALGKRSERRVLRLIGNVYTTIMRGTPELLIILLVYYGGQAILSAALDAAGIERNIQINVFLAGVIALSLPLIAYTSEVWMGALQQLSRGQWEAAYALGLSRFVCYRKVIFPQILKASLPTLMNYWLILVKDTSLISTIALTDIMRATKVAVAVTMEPMFFYSLACLIYFSIGLLSSLAIKRLEGRYGVDPSLERA